jgi:hypothetical protein
MLSATVETSVSSVLWYLEGTDIEGLYPFLGIDSTHWHIEYNPYDRTKHDLQQKVYNLLHPNHLVIHSFWSGGLRV